MTLRGSCPGGDRSSPGAQTHDVPSLVSYEKEFSKKGSQSQVHIFMSAGGLEAPKLPVFREFAEMMKTEHPGMKMETRIIEGGTHNSSEADGYLEGLRSVYAPVSVAVAPQILDQYVGKYAIAPGHPGEIVKENGTVPLSQTLTPGQRDTWR